MVKGIGMEKGVISGEEEFGGFKYECGCRIWGIPPIVTQIWFCRDHEIIGKELEKSAPHAAKLIKRFP